MPPCAAGHVRLGAARRATRTGLGRALVWADREGVDELHLVVDDPDAAGVLARRATAFARPPSCVAGRGPRPGARRAGAVPAPVEPPPVARELIGLLLDAGVEVIVEHGEIRGEIRGLEVARVVVDDDGAARVEVGVGRHDREAFAMVHGDLPTADALGVGGRQRRHLAPSRRRDPPPEPPRPRALAAVAVMCRARAGRARRAPARPSPPSPATA